jgi:hypothetical protein
VLQAAKRRQFQGDDGDASELPRLMLPQKPAAREVALEQPLLASGVDASATKVPPLLSPRTTRLPERVACSHFSCPAVFFLRGSETATRGTCLGFCRGTACPVPLLCQSTTAAS